MRFDYLKQKRIMLVDDEQELLDLVASILKEEGFTNVQTAKTVNEAIALSEICRPQKEVFSMNETGRQRRECVR